MAKNESRLFWFNETECISFFSSNNGKVSLDITSPPGPVFNMSIEQAENLIDEIKKAIIVSKKLIKSARGAKK